MLSSWIEYFALWLCIISLAAAQDLAIVPRAAKSSLPKPISVAPSQYWEGDDGPWSSFTLQVGTPVQDVRVFISTASQVSWVVLEGQGCRANDATCASARGGLFNMNASSTWRSNGFWQLGNERNLGIYANGLFGNDTIGLGIQGSGGPSLADQIMAVIGTEQIYVGMFAVNPKRTNYTGITEQGQASYMTTLKQQNLIPSSSFGYTAGAQYRLKKVLGSLTLGGYDESRFTPNNMSFSFAPDTDRDIVVGIQSITSTDKGGTKQDLLPTGINAYVDSTIPQIWLPLEACKAFEKAFGLTYDPENSIYPVSDSLHQKLFAQNPSISFTLGNAASGGQTIDITLPYNSFDLQAQPPFTSNATKYFPLQRAMNDTQYTLGRAFLQEAYLIVDWERSNFSISQCLFDPNISQEKLIPIKSVDSTSGQADQHGGTNTGRIIGIVVGIVVAVLILGGIAVFFYLRHRKRKCNPDGCTTGKDDESERIRQGFAKAELDTDSRHARYEMAGAEGHSEAQSSDVSLTEKNRHPSMHAELVGDRLVGELHGSGQPASELPAYKGFSGPYHEMYDPSTVPVELPADIPHELPASPPPVFRRSSNSSSAVFRSGNLPPVSHSSRSSPLRQLSGGRRSGNHRPAPSPPTSTSRGNSTQSRPSAPSSLARGSRGPSSPDLSGTSSPREQEPFSPISPIGGSEDGTDHAGLFSLVRGLADPARHPETSGPRSRRTDSLPRFR
ncbi:MAG: hypothetical protein Q9222_006987 [Ikaeria aurantiellina]